MKKKRNTVNDSIFKIIFTLLSCLKHSITTNLNKIHFRSYCNSSYTVCKTFKIFNSKERYTLSYESKKVLQRLFNEYQKDFIVKLRSLRSTDPKAYWSLLNKGCDKSNTVNQKVADFSFRCFFDYLKNLNNVDNNADVVSVIIQL